MQEKMSDREKEMEDEKSRLLDLVSKLEKQLANQNAQMEQVNCLTVSHSHYFPILISFI